MQQLQPLAANQLHNPPTHNLGHFSLPHALSRISLIFFILLLLSVSAVMAATGVSKKRHAISMQAVSNTGTVSNTSDQFINTPNIKSIGTDPPPESSKTSVSVNGQNIPIPQQGSTSQTIISGNTKTDVEVTNSSSSSTEGSHGTSSSSDNLNLSVTSSSSSASSTSNY